MNKESATAILGTLIQRHQSAAKQYRKTASTAEDGALKDLMQSLNTYHHKLENEIKKKVPTVMDIPMTINAKNKVLSNLDDEVTELDEAIGNGNAMKVYKLCYGEEQDILEYYQTSMQQVGIPDGIIELLEKQTDKVSDVVQRLERGTTVPPNENILVDIV